MDNENIIGNNFEVKNEHELITGDLNMDNIIYNTSDFSSATAENTELLFENNGNIPKILKTKIRKENYQGILQCYVCGHEQENITEHIKKEHYADIKSSMFGPPRQFQCQKCRLMFVSEDSLGLHVCGTVKPT